MKCSVPLLAAGLLLSSVASPLTAEEVSFKEFQSLQKQLTPNPKEAWRTIPWNVSLLKAQEKAVAEKKPLFIWAMDGHPLGCT